MTNQATFHIASLLDKMCSSDKDFRYMATNDLMSELQKDAIKLDDDKERLVVQSLLRLLEDKNGEVQNLAVKCLGPLVTKVKVYQVEWIVDTLCTNMASNKEQLRDISSIGLKTVISELPPASSSLSSNICKRITGRLTDTITKAEEQAVQLEALDILADLLSRFGALLVSFHSSVLTCILPLLSSQRLAIRKKTIVALSHLVLSANISLFLELINHLINELKGKRNSERKLDIRTLIQCIGAICRQSGQRVGDYLDEIIPIIIEYSNIDGDDELRETCIQTLESFVCKCPKEVTQYIQQIISLCLKYLCYDPNYNYGDGSDDDMDSIDDDEDEDEDDDDDEYSDDDDMSWKVRRASAKCLSAILGSRMDLLSEFYINVAPKLIARFKEREENVKSDIFQAYISLLRQTKPVAMNDALEDKPDSPLSMLKQQVPLVVKALHKQLMEKNIKTRQGCFNLFTELVGVLPSGLTEHIDKIMPGIHFCITDRNSTSNMKIDTLSFLGCILQHIKAEVFYPHIHQFLPAVVECIHDPFYKITSEALTVAQNTIKVMRPTGTENNFDFKPYINDLYQSILHRLRATDIDQEVKEKSITCMGQLLRNMGDNLSKQLPECLPIFLDRLRNEITRLTTVKSLTTIASSPLHIDLSILLLDGIPLMATFLRKNHRGLKLHTLTCLDLLMQNYGNVMSTKHFEAVLDELSNLISETDLHVSQLSLNLLTTMISKQQLLLKKVSSTVLSHIVILTRSPLLQGHALNSMVSFLTTLVRYSSSGLGYTDLLQMLTEVIYGSTTENIHKSAYHSIARCASALTIACPSEAEAVVTKFIKDIKNSGTNDSIRLFSLLTIGEIGAHLDLSSKAELKNVIVNSFSADSEDIKTAASFSLGHITIGNMDAYLPFILKEIESNAKRQYLLLHSLKEIIVCQSTDPSSVKSLEQYVPSIWSLLLTHCENKEEGTRNVVAECLGKLTMVEPQKLLPELKSYLSSDLYSAQMRSTVLTAFKFTITDQPQSIDILLKDHLQAFLQPITDNDLNVRRVALTTFNSAAHNKPGLIRDLLTKILPHLYNETKVKKELIREVEMGPFKHTVDDGLDIRKAAFECMYTLLDSCLDRLDIFEFLNHVENGLKDHYDIKMLTYLMLVRLSKLSPNAVFQHLERIIDPLRTTIQAKVKANSVKQEYEKQDELKRSALRAVCALQKIPDAESHPILSDFVSQIRSNSDTKVMFESVQRDPSSTSLDKMDTAS